VQAVAVSHPSVVKVKESGHEGRSQCASGADRSQADAETEGQESVSEVIIGTTNSSNQARPAQSISAKLIGIAPPHPGTAVT
jgi:hypothetical protein